MFCFCSSWKLKIVHLQFTELFWHKSTLHDLGSVVLSKKPGYMAWRYILAEPITDWWDPGQLTFVSCPGYVYLVPHLLWWLPVLLIAMSGLSSWCANNVVHNKTHNFQTWHVDISSAATVWHHWSKLSSVSCWLETVLLISQHIRSLWIVLLKFLRYWRA